MKLVKVGHTGVLGPPATEEIVFLYSPDVEPVRVQMDEGGEKKSITCMYMYSKRSRTCTLYFRSNPCITQLSYC